MGDETVVDPAAPVAPVAAPAAAPAAPPPPDPQIAALQAQVAQTQQQMVQQQMQTMQMMGSLMPKPAAEAPIDTSQLDPTVVKLLNQQRQQIEGTVAQQIDQLRDANDALAYQNAMAQRRPTPEAMAEADRVYSTWRTNGFKVQMPGGQMAPPSRIDALTFAMGNLAGQGKNPSLPQGAGAPMPVAGNPGMLAERPGVLPAGPIVTEPAQMTREQRIAEFERVHGDREW